MSYGWEGEKVRLVPLDRDKHLDNALRWFNDPEITQWLETGDWPLTRGAEEEFFRAAERQDRANVQFAVENLEGEHVGFSGLRSIDWQSRVAVSGSVIGTQGSVGQRARHRRCQRPQPLRLRSARSASVDRDRDRRQLRLAGDARQSGLPRGRPGTGALLETRRLPRPGDPGPPPRLSRGASCNSDFGFRISDLPRTCPLG